jgi:2-hydroxycyclohexanecarboxyl-CoA dehydrogenase
VVDGRLLEGRIAVVTGGAGGIGEGIARSLHGAGATLILNDINETRLAALADELRATGTAPHLVPGDIRDESTVTRVAETASGVDDGRVDVLVNNVGDYRPPGRFFKTTPAEWHALYAINFEHVLRLTHAIAPLMVANGCGSIVNVTTVEAHRGIPRNAVYSAYKAAIWAFTRSLAVELGNDGVRVNAIAPDMADTFQTPATMMLGDRDPALVRCWRCGAVPRERSVAVRHRRDDRGRRRDAGGERLVPQGEWSGLDEPSRRPLNARSGRG